jgi:hypothetical protein
LSLEVTEILPYVESFASKAVMFPNMGDIRKALKNWESRAGFCLSRETVIIFSPYLVESLIRRV